MSFDLKALWEWLKLKPRHLFALGVVSLAITGLPRGAREYLGYEHLILAHRGWVSLVGLCSMVYGFVLLLAGTKPWFVRKWQNWRTIRKAPDVLRALTREEKATLGTYIEADAVTRTFAVGGGVINSLVQKGVVYRASEASVHYDCFAYNLQPWVSMALERHPELKDEIRGYASQHEDDQDE